MRSSHRNNWRNQPFCHSKLVSLLFLVSLFLLTTLRCIFLFFCKVVNPKTWCRCVWLCCCRYCLDMDTIRVFLIQIYFLVVFSYIARWIKKCLTILSFVLFFIIIIIVIVATFYHILYRHQVGQAAETFEYYNAWFFVVGPDSMSKNVRSCVHVCVCMNHVILKLFASFIFDMTHTL